MDGFLVVLSHMHEDLPLRLFEIAADAIRFAERHGPMPTPEEAAFFKTDCSTPQVLQVYEFRRGKPAEEIYYRVLEL